jgi:hypothetical protein
MRILELREGARPHLQRFIAGRSRTRWDAHKLVFWG